MIPILNGTPANSQVIIVLASQISLPESAFLPSNKRDSVVLPQKRASKQYILNYPPSPPPGCSPAFKRPVPAVPLSTSSILDFSTQHLLSPYPPSSASSRPFSPRPPPRNSVPAGFSFDDGTSSTSSYAIYQVKIFERNVARALSVASTTSPCSTDQRPCAETTRQRRR